MLFCWSGDAIRVCTSSAETGAIHGNHFRRCRLYVHKDTEGKNVLWVIRQYSILINGKARPFQGDQTRIPENSPDFGQMNVQSIHLEPGVLADAKFLYRLKDVHRKKPEIYQL
jgi:hypothetical protein